MNRIKELDAARGFCILCMIAVHLLYDLTELYHLFSLPASSLFYLVKEQGGMVFFLLSGVCATLGRRHLRRGVTVFCCGLAVSAVTVLAGYLPVRFGVLHCLGCCMVLWIFFRQLPTSALPFLGVVFLVSGSFFETVTVASPLLYPLGLCRADFSSADYFPLFPYFGFFLLGTFLGRTFYRHRRGLLKLPFSSPPARFLCFCGRHSLLLYLAHQPVLILAIETAMFFRRYLP